MPPASFQATRPGSVALLTFMVALNQMSMGLYLPSMPTMAGALERATRFKGLAVFQTDNSQSKFQAVMDAMKTDVTWVDSGLGAHATAMFLDDRPSTLQLREWFRALVAR